MGRKEIVLVLVLMQLLPPEEQLVAAKEIVLVLMQLLPLAEQLVATKEIVLVPMQLVTPEQQLVAAKEIVSVVVAAQTEGEHWMERLLWKPQVKVETIVGLSD